MAKTENQSQSSGSQLDNKNLTQTNLFIKDKQIAFVSLSLEQAMGEHHQFHIELDYDRSGAPFPSNPSDRLDYIGKSVKITFQQGQDGASQYTFYGIITTVSVKAKEGSHGIVHLYGGSPTIMLERGERSEVFGEKNLKNIVKSVCDGVVTSSHLDPQIQPQSNPKIGFLLQYKQNDWQYLRLLSHYFGENLYYTGEHLIFGSLADGSARKLVYDRELTQIDFVGNMQPYTFGGVQYDEQTDNISQKNTPEANGGGQYVAQVVKNSSELTEKNPAISLAPFKHSNMELTELLQRQQQGVLSNSLMIKGYIKTCHAALGQILTINLPDHMGGDNLGTYRVSKANHYVDETGLYQGYFECVSSDISYIPCLDVIEPQVGTLIGKVWGNEDSNGMGRVQVEFQFGSEPACPSWLRVMTPDGGGLVGNGSSKKGEVPQSRGFFFVPEVGDQVVVGFEGGRLDSPFVMGSLFHGNNAGAISDGNNTKTIKTKSGHTIELIDQEGINIKDKSGNIISLKTNSMMIEISAPETLMFSAKNIFINASQNLSTSSGKNTSFEVSENFTLSVDKDSQLMTDSLTTSVLKDYSIKAKDLQVSAEQIEAEATKKDVSIKSSKKVNIKSSDKINLF